MYKPPMFSKLKIINSVSVYNITNILNINKIKNPKKSKLAKTTFLLPQKIKSFLRFPQLEK